jgi:AmpD protein
MSKEHLYSARWWVMDKMPEGPPRDELLRVLRAILGPEPGPVNDPESVPVEIKSPIITPARFREVQHSTPNMGGKMKPIGVVFHHSAGSFSGSLSWIKQGRSKVSYNTIIEEDGTRHNVVPLDRVAWHAGKSTFKGRSGCNSFMVGFAFSGSTYDRALTEAELASAVEFVRTYGPRYGWTLDTMTDHRQVSPGRKNNLNPVEWERLKERLRVAF